MMNRILIVGILIGSFGFSPLARAGHEEANPDRIREVFATSNDAKLQLAAEALGDDGLEQVFEELKQQNKKADLVKKILKVGK